jgi:hypothetical protein
MPMVPDGFFFKGGAGTGVGPLTGFGWAGVGDAGGPGMGVGNFGVGVGTTGAGAGGQQSLAQHSSDPESFWVQHEVPHFKTSLQ